MYLMRNLSTRIRPDPSPFPSNAAISRGRSRSCERVYPPLSLSLRPQRRHLDRSRAEPSRGAAEKPVLSLSKQPTHFVLAFCSSSPKSCQAPRTPPNHPNPFHLNKIKNLEKWGIRYPQSATIKSATKIGASSAPIRVEFPFRPGPTAGVLHLTLQPAAHQEAPYEHSTSN